MMAIFRHEGCKAHNKKPRIMGILQGFSSSCAACFLVVIGGLEPPTPAL